MARLEEDVVKVLFDHNMPPQIARAIHEIVSVDGHESWALRDRFDKRIDDINLFERLGTEKNWVVISKDGRQAKRKPEKAAILRYGVVAIYLSSTVESLDIHQQAATILWHWDAIVRLRGLQHNGLFSLPINKQSRFRSL